MLMSMFLLGAANEQQMKQDMDTCGETGSPACSNERLPEKAETQESKFLQVGQMDAEGKQLRSDDHEENIKSKVMWAYTNHANQYCSDDWLARHDVHTKVEDVKDCQQTCDASVSCQAISFSEEEGNKCVLCDTTTMKAHNNWDTYVKATNSGSNGGNGGGAGQVCINADSNEMATNAHKRHCSIYNTLPISAYICDGRFDDDDWTAEEMCCVCQGREATLTTEELQRNSF